MQAPPILLVDFWGDGPLVEGCLAGGKLYVHINNKGDVEPCIFCHFAVDNIKDKSLMQALNSDFFKAIRRSQPFGHNDLRPCPLIDHPGAMAGLVEEYSAYPTHEGAESLFGEFIPHLRECARNVAQIYKKVWDEEYKWVYDWRHQKSKE
ncbi:MAG: SPASM domain-containing protein [Actinomycetota bacterium]|nr:SPASM domain-containing protein [Actinomycetota bacterium]